jgi:hypothetical protein
LFGAEDRFLNWIAESIVKFDRFPLINNGQNLLQPVYAIDVAKAIKEIIKVFFFNLFSYNF